MLTVLIHHLGKDLDLCDFLGIIMAKIIGFQMTMKITRTRFVMVIDADDTVTALVMLMKTLPYSWPDLSVVCSYTSCSGSAAR